MSADVLLSRLQKVKATGPDRWIACCPAHQDKTPSLTVRELADGRVLVHCFTGCATADVLVAVGLEFADLYPEPVPELNHPERKTQREGFEARDVLTALLNEVTHIALAAGMIQRRGWLNDGECERLALAYERVVGAMAYVERRHG